MSNDNKTLIQDILGVISTDELVAELTKRKGVVCSIWNEHDVLPMMEENERFSDLTDEQQVEYARDFLDTVSDGLQETLGTRGNAYLDDRFDKYDPNPLVGRRVRLKVSKDLFSENDIVPAGVTGTIVTAEADLIGVLLDEHRASLDHWDNELYWYSDQTGSILGLYDQFNAEVEFI